jgi:hypothetical protein
MEEYYISSAAKSGVLIKIRSPLYQHEEEWTLQTKENIQV